MDRVTFVEDSLYHFRPYHFKFSKRCLPQILLGPDLNTLTHLQIPLRKLITNTKYTINPICVNAKAYLELSRTSMI